MDFAKYLGVVFLLILVYLVVANGRLSTMVINALSSANTNAIFALQGRDLSGRNSVNG
jgi:hypothetical protein